MKAGKTRRHGWMNEGLVSEAGREGDGQRLGVRAERASQGGERMGEKGGEAAVEINQKRRGKVKRK